MGYSRCVSAKSLQSCLTLCKPVDCSPPGSPVHEILQARILEWVAMPSFRGSSGPRDQTCISYVQFMGSQSVRRDWWTFISLSSTYSVCLSLSNQSILKEISPEHSLEGLMLKLKLQYFGHLMRRTDSFEKTLILGKIEGRRRRRQQRMRWLDGITIQWTWVWVNSESWWWTGRPSMLQSIGSQRVRHDWMTELISPYVWL